MVNSSSSSSTSSSSSSHEKRNEEKMEQATVIAPATYVGTLQPVVGTSYSVHSGQMSSLGQQQYVVQQRAGQTIEFGKQQADVLVGSTAVSTGERAYVQYVTDPRMLQQTTTVQTITEGGAANAAYSTLAAEYTGRQEGSVSLGAYVTTGEKIYGEQRLISTTSHVDESRSSVISERVIEHEVRIPKKIVREEIVEKVIRIPEKQIVEEIIEESQIVREKIIEIAKPTIVEKVIEIPEISFVERLVEVPEKIIQEKIIEQEKVYEKEVVVEIPKMVPRDKVVEVPIYEYVDKPYERMVYVEDIQEVIVEKKVPKAQYVEKPVPQEVRKEVPVPFERKIPVPLEGEVTYEYKLPTIHPRYTKASYPVYLPRFIEVPVATELLNQDLTMKSQKFLSQVSQLLKNAASLCEIEGLAAQIMKTDFQSQLQSSDLQAAVLNAWKTEALPLHHESGQVMTKAVTQEIVSVPGFQASVTSQPTYTTTTTLSQPIITTTTASPVLVETTTVVEGKKHKKHHKKHHKH